jgi:hypothetical protein
MLFPSIRYAPNFEMMYISDSSSSQTVFKFEINTFDILFPSIRYALIVLKIPIASLLHYLAESTNMLCQVLFPIIKNVLNF